MVQLKALIDNWILIAQGLLASVGALAFLVAFMYKIVAVDPASVAQAKKWIGRIVFGTIGVEVAGTLTHALIASVPRRFTEPAGCKCFRASCRGSAIPSARSSSC